MPTAILALLAWVRLSVAELAGAGLVPRRVIKRWCLKKFVRAATPGRPGRGNSGRFSAKQCYIMVVCQLVQEELGQSALDEDRGRGIDAAAAVMEDHELLSWLGLADRADAWAQERLSADFQASLRLSADFQASLLAIGLDAPPPNPELERRMSILRKMILERLGVEPAPGRLSTVRESQPPASDEWLSARL
jgi:hypothetical protein